MDYDQTDLWKIAYIDERRNKIGIYCLEDTSVSTEIQMPLEGYGKDIFMKLYEVDSNDILYKWIETTEVQGKEYNMLSERMYKENHDE